MTGYTPGPWVSDERVEKWRGGSFPSVRIAYMRNEHVSSPIALCEAQYLGEEASLANARIMAAAPEMLGALRLTERGDTDIPADIRAVIRAALAKATQP